MDKRMALATLAAGILSGCASLLPSGTTATPPTFASFDDARAAAEKVVAFETRTADLKSFGFDPKEGQNVTLIPYPEIVARLAPYPGVPVSGLDPGIRQCIEAQSTCRGYLFHFEHQDRQREGSFWLDFLNLRRTTTVTGWWFDTLIVVTDDTVLFKNYAGQPRTDRVEKQVNPLGPLQPMGESAAASAIVH
ncbi:MAG TPA: hypothetical protein VN663_15155 [Ramlibacter sp.]|nr:hypothetical protein [Ramlibacter sp.]